MAAELYEALAIIECRDCSAAVAFLLARGAPLPHVPWTVEAERRSGAAYERVGQYEDDARYVDPAREELWSAVARAALATAVLARPSAQPGPQEHS